MPRFSSNLEKTLLQAVEMARDMLHEYVTVEHLLLALTNDKDARDVMQACLVDIDTLQSEVREYLNSDIMGLSIRKPSDGAGAPEPNLKDWMPKHTPSFQRVILRAVIQVQSVEKEEVTGEHVLVSIFSEPDNFAVYFLQEQEMTKLDAMNYISHGIRKERDKKSDARVVKVDLSNKENIFFSSSQGLGLQQFSATSKREDGFQNLSKEKDNGCISVNSTMPPSGGNALSDKRKFIETYCVNLNEKAKQGKIDPLIGRANEIDRIVHILCRRNKNNPILVGEPGVGKTAIIEGLALLIHTKKVPQPLRKSTIFSLDIGALLAGTRYRGDFEERFKNLLKALVDTDGAILFIDEIHTIIGAGAANGSSMDASNLLKPLLGASRLRVIGSTTHKEYQQYFEKDSAFLRRLQKLVVEEPSESEALEILKNGPVPSLECFHKVQFLPKTIEEAIKLAIKYLHGRFLPDKAIDILDEAAAAQKLKVGDKKDPPKKESEKEEETSKDTLATTPPVAEPKKAATSPVTIEDIQTVVSKMAQIKPQHITDGEEKVLKEIDTRLKEAIYGQDTAIDALSDVIRLSRAGLKTPGKPIACYLFSGPTGVGKTEIAIQLSSILNIPLTRFDMSEYMEKHTASRLIGSPPGYVGFEQGGLLTDTVSKTPYCVLLLDEIEKAHVDIFGLLLQVMDYGKLTDHNGKKVDFQNVILIMTTNAGADGFNRSAIGFEERTCEGSDNEEIKRFFRPEFLNRLDGIINFSPLKSDVMVRIVDKFIKQLQNQLTEKNITLTVNAKAQDWLLRKGFDDKLGARPLERAIQDNIKKPMSREMLYGSLTKGGQVTIDVASDDTLSLNFTQKDPSIPACSSPPALEKTAPDLVNASETP